MGSIHHGERLAMRSYPRLFLCVHKHGFFLGSAIPNIMLDFAFLVLPLRPLWKLKMRLSQRIIMVVVFVLGYLYVHLREYTQFPLTFLSCPSFAYCRVYKLEKILIVSFQSSILS